MVSPVGELRHYYKGNGRRQCFWLLALLIGLWGGLLLPASGNEMARA